MFAVRKMHHRRNLADRFSRNDCPGYLGLVCFCLAASIFVVVPGTTCAVTNWKLWLRPLIANDAVAREAISRKARRVRSI